jgi:tetratricopeptide (TPR) repeat protein
MRVIILPSSDEGWLSLLICLALVIAVGVAIFVWQYFWPSTRVKVLADERYRQALVVYADKLQREDAVEPTREERQAAFTEATEFLVREHGIPSAEAAARRHLMVAAYDRDQSYELRNEALGFEEAGAYASAIACYERAARLQEENDPKDHQFLLKCVSRVRRKQGSRS